MKYLLIVVCLSLFLAVVQGSSLINWLWNKPNEDTNVLVADGIPLISIPYETMTDDEKFLQEAAKVTDIRVSSPLETCQHKVVMKIRTSCSAMTEEQLAKLSVNLLNCQSAVEGRKLFPCTEDMTLKQCTTEMDADMWNAYHLMSNRARAVCYAARSTQFRALTELTVNKLMQSAHSQVEALSSLKDSHDRLQDKTLEALSSLSNGNKILLEQQRNLRDAQSSAHNLVASNLRELQNEKALIRIGHAQLSTMTEDIKNRLEKASQQLMTQAAESEENHKELLEDLMNIQQQAQSIWEKIESSTERIVMQNAEAAARYEETLLKLEKINNTIHYIWNITETMRLEIDDKLGWITDYMGNTGEQLQKAYRITLHVLFLLATMIVAAFLNAPFLTRATIMGLIPLNLVTYLKHGMNACLDFTSLTVLIFLITGMHFVMVAIQRMFGLRTKAQLADDFEPSNHSLDNGRLSGRYSTPRLEKKSSTLPLTTRLINKIEEIYNFITQQLIRCKDKTVTILQTAGSLCRQNSSPVEELSCSYGPSRRNREELVNDYARDYPSMSEDGTDFENSDNVHEKYDNFNVIDDTFNENNLRKRWNDRSTLSARNYTQQNTSRSVSPNSLLTTRMLCSALTKSGAKCRSRAQQGRYFCSRHTQGSSILGD